MKLFKAEIDDGLSEIIKSSATISYASEIEPCAKALRTSSYFKTLASIEDSDLYYTQSILVSSSWNKNDDIFDRAEVWVAKNTPEHKPTNLEHDEGTIIGHIVSNYPITEDGILIDENTPLENLPEKFHILTGSVIYQSYTQPELRERTEALIKEIENGTKYVSMECFFKGFDYGLINKATNEYKILPRDNSTAHLSKYLRAYGGLGEHENYRIGRVLRNITFSGKGFVNRPANPDSIIFTKDSFKFLENTHLEKNSNFLRSGVTISQSSINSENTIMNQDTEVVSAADCTEATSAADALATELKNEIETLKANHEAALTAAQAEKDQLVVEHEEAAKKMKTKCEELETQLAAANEALAGYMKKEKKMVRKASLVDGGVSSEDAESIVEKFDALDDETFAAMAETWLDMAKKIKKNDKVTKAEESADITEVLENVEETAEIVPAVGGEDESAVETTRAALVNFVCNRLGKKLNKGE